MLEAEQIEALIVRYLKQEIGEEELCLLEAWLQEEPENKKYFFQLKGISDSCHHTFLPSEAWTESSWQSMKSRLHAKPECKSFVRTFQKNRWVYGKYAAILLIVFGLGWGIGALRGSGRWTATEKILVCNEVSVEKGGPPNTIKLSDGTKVVLNAATTFKYPADFGDKERTVYLDGEACFEVAKDAGRPFVVKLKKQDIQVLGTIFNVEAYSDENTSVITLLSGSIALETFNEKGESMSHMFLKPNQQAFSDNRTGSVSIRETDATLSNAYIRGEYKFRDEPLSVIVKRLERHYGVCIHIENESLKQEKYTGTFSLDQDIKEVFRIIDYEKRLSMKYDKKDIFITKK